MLKPWRPRKSHDRRVTGLFWMMTRQQIRMMGVASKLERSLKCYQVDMSGARLDWRRRFRVSSVCGRSWYHRKLGKEADTTMRMERKWALKVRMARLAIFWRWKYGGTSWKVQFHSSMMVQRYLVLS